MVNKYDSWHEDRVGDDDLDTAWYNFVLSRLELLDLNAKRVLEIGCGRGSFASHIENKFPQIDELVACDFSLNALEIAKSRSTNKISWMKEDIMNMTFQADSFDVIISCETIEHIKNPKKALEELNRVLKPGGYLILTCPNYFNFFGIWCLYRSIIRKPYTEGGQPYVNYILIPTVLIKLRKLKFKFVHFHTSELVIPWFVPKHFWNKKLPRIIKILGFRTFYLLKKRDVT